LPGQQFESGALPCLATRGITPHIIDIHTDLCLFRERLDEACRISRVKSDQLCRTIGLGGRRAVDFELFGLKAIDVYRLAQIGDIRPVRRLAARAVECHGVVEMPEDQIERYRNSDIGTNAIDEV
jgi:hypothetical protein